METFIKMFLLLAFVACGRGDYNPNHDEDGYGENGSGDDEGNNNEQPGPEQPDSGKTFSNFVVPLFQTHCQRCHVGEAFLTNEKVARGEAAKEIIEDEMPQGSQSLKAFAPYKANVLKILGK